MEDHIKWQAHEYDHQEKSSDWFWALGIISVSIAATSIILGNILFAILVIVGAFALSIFAARKPGTIDFELNRKGLVAGRLQYLYSSLESFWVEDRFGENKILFKSHRAILPLIVVPMGDVNPNTVKEYLRKNLKEEEIHEPLLQKLMERFGF